MTFDLDRRRFLTTSLAAAAGGSLGILMPNVRHSAFAAAASSPLTAQRRSIDVNGKAASVFGLIGPDGNPGVVLDPGQRFTVDLRNRCGEDTVIHWHGQTPPNPQDGVVETGSALIPPDGDYTYDFAARAGTHWMHSHHGLQEQRLMAAPLIVRTEADLRLDAQEVTVLLHDFSFREPAELLRQVMGTDGGHGAKAMPGMTHSSMPGVGMPGMVMPGTAMSGTTMSGTAMPGMVMPGTTKPGATTGGGTMGGMPGMASPNGNADLNDIDYDAYLANDRTLEDPLVVRTERNGRVRLRLINGATSTAFWIDLGPVVATAIAVDGNAIKPITGSRFPMAQGQRLDLVIAMPPGGGVVPVLAQREGDRARTGIILATPDAKVPRIASLAATVASAVDLSLEQRLVAATPLAARAPDVTYRVVLSGTMQPYAWFIDDRGWDDHKALAVMRGQRVVVEMMNHSMMAHPMHLHGHHFQVVALNGKPVNGALRDTVLVPAHMGTVTVAFDADNPGRWLFHCHNLLHMATGMMTEFTYDRTA
jgi:FtsP/CotA-like multicopper oxidase with cupredoxin domain